MLNPVTSPGPRPVPAAGPIAGGSSRLQKKVIRVVPDWGASLGSRVHSQLRIPDRWTGKGTLCHVHLPGVFPR